MPTRKQILQMIATLPFMAPVASTFHGLNPNRSGLDSVTNPDKSSNSADGNSLHSRDLLRELGLRTFINGRGTITTLSGSLMPPEVIQAIASTSDRFVNLIELNEKAGQRIAEMLRCEDAHVTAGAASAIQLGTAACITGMDRELVRQIPHLSDPRPEVIIQKSHRFAFDQMITNCGVNLVEVEGPDEMEGAISDRTIMAFYFNAAREHSISRQDFVRIGKQHNIPTFNDAAADVPPVDNLFNYIEMGFDLVTFSGGKAIRGPQSAGLLFGRKDLIEAARLNHSPFGSSGRGMKVNKEEILGMMVALELYLNKDHDQEWAMWESWVAQIAESVEEVPGVETEQYIPEVANHVPHLRIRWNGRRIPITGDELREQLRSGHPSIEVSGGRDTIEMNVFMMKPEEVRITGQRIRDLLQRASA